MADNSVRIVDFDVMEETGENGGQKTVQRHVVQGSADKLDRSTSQSGLNIKQRVSTLLYLRLEIRSTSLVF